MKTGQFFAHSDYAGIWEVVRQFGPFAVINKVGTKLELYIPPDMVKYWRLLPSQQTWGTH